MDLVTGDKGISMKDKGLFLQGSSRLTFFCFVAVIALSLSGCVPYRYSTQCFGSDPEALEGRQCRNKACASQHWLYTFVPRHRCQIQWYDLPHWTTWALLGNDDDGIFGEEPTANYRLRQKPCFGKAAAWAWRNPLHNFCFYVIGSADGVNSEYTLLRLTPECSEAFVYRSKSTTVFAGKDSSLYLALHGWKPFISSRIVWSERRESRFYIGWRCRGNFGIRFNPWGRRKQS